MQKGKKAKY